MPENLRHSIGQQRQLNARGADGAGPAPEKRAVSSPSVPSQTDSHRISRVARDRRPRYPGNEYAPSSADRRSKNAASAEQCIVS